MFLEKRGGYWKSRITDVSFGRKDNLQIVIFPAVKENFISLLSKNAEKLNYICIVNICR